MSTHPRPQEQDLTARARIRNAALELYAARGEDKISMRTVAAEVGVTIGLIQHHFGTKEGLGQAVDDHVVSYFVDALAMAERTGTPAEVVDARDEAVQQMLRANPTVVRYINRALIEPDRRGSRLLRGIVALTVREVENLRRSGHASTSRSEKIQVLRTLMGQVGQLLIDPVVDAVWDELDGDPRSRPSARIVVNTDSDVHPFVDPGRGPDRE